MIHKQTRAIFYAILAAVFYALNAPFSKLLLEEVPATMMAAFLYLGAGLSLGLIGLIKKWAGKALNKESKEQPLTKKELPYTIGMILLDILAPIFLMIGLTKTTAANASLLNNFEIVATSLIALAIFKEQISKRLWWAIALVTLSSMILSFEDAGSLKFSVGSLFVLLACVCWGLENNCTRKLSSKDPLQIVVIKGLCSGLGSLLIAFAVGEVLPNRWLITLTLLLGAVAYGLSIYFYVYAQRTLGAAKTSTYYAIAPFIGVFLSLVIFQTIPGVSFFAALLIMAAGTYLASTDRPSA